MLQIELLRSIRGLDGLLVVQEKSSDGRKEGHANVHNRGARIVTISADKFERLSFIKVAIFFAGAITTFATTLAEFIVVAVVTPILSVCNECAFPVFRVFDLVY